MFVPIGGSRENVCSKLIFGSETQQDGLELLDSHPSDGELRRLVAIHIPAMLVAAATARHAARHVPSHLSSPMNKFRRSSKRILRQPAQQLPPASLLVLQAVQQSCGLHCIVSLCRIIYMRSTRGRAKGSTDKSKRRRFNEKDVAEATALKTTLPLPLLCVVRSHLGTLVWLQLCNLQGITPFSFVHLGPRVPRAAKVTLVSAAALLLLSC